MVHIVKKKIKGKNYLYIQRSIYNPKTKKRSTEHCGYLGREDKYTSEQIEQKLKEVEENENRRTKG